jgi:hypothetical protein
VEQREEAVRGPGDGACLFCWKACLLPSYLAPPHLGVPSGSQNPAVSCGTRAAEGVGEGHSQLSPQGRLTGLGGEDLPTIVIVAHYDAFGVAPVSMCFLAHSHSSSQHLERKSAAGRWGVAGRWRQCAVAAIMVTGVSIPTARSSPVLRTLSSRIRGKPGRQHRIMPPGPHSHALFRQFCSNTSVTV